MLIPLPVTEVRIEVRAFNHELGGTTIQSNTDKTTGHPALQDMKIKQVFAASVSMFSRQEPENTFLPAIKTNTRKRAFREANTTLLPLQTNQIHLGFWCQMTTAN